MFKYVIICVLAVISALVTEKSADGILKDKPFNLHSKINPKRLTFLLIINISVWVLCLFVNSSDLIPTINLGLGFCALTFISLSDYYTKKIPNLYLIVLFVLACVFTILDKSAAWYMHLLGGALGYIILFFMRLLGEKLTKTDAIGKGDVFLSGILGLFLGLRAYLLCGIVTCISALITVRIVRSKKGYDKVHLYPFSPFFMFGYTVSILLGNFIIAEYTSLVLNLI